MQMRKASPKFVLIRHSPDKDVLIELIQRHHDHKGMIVIGFPTQNQADDFYNEIIQNKSLGRDIVRIRKKLDCPVLQKENNCNSYEEDNELMTINCISCKGWGKVSLIINSYCKYILKSKNLSEYNHRFSEIQYRHNMMCPAKLNLQLLAYARKPIVITTNHGINFYEFIHQNVEGSIFIINHANQIKDQAYAEFELNKDVKKYQSNKSILADYITKNLSVMHLDKDGFLEIGFTEVEYNKYTHLVNNIHTQIQQPKKELVKDSELHKEINSIKEKIFNNMLVKQYSETYKAYTIYRAFHFFEQLLNPLNKVEIIRIKKDNRISCRLIIRAVVKAGSIIEQRLTQKLTEADKVYLLESFTPDKKYFKYYYGIRPFIEEKHTKNEFNILFIGGKSNLNYQWRSSINSDRLISTIKSVEREIKRIGTSGMKGAYIARNIEEYEKIKSRLDNTYMCITYSRGYLDKYKRPDHVPVSIGLPFPNRDGEEARKETISAMCKRPIDFEHFYWDLSLTELMNNLTINSNLCKYAVALNVRKEKIAERIIQIMPWSKDYKFIQIEGTLKPIDIGFKIRQVIEGEKEPKTITQQRIREEILCFISENDRMCANDLKKIKGNKESVKREFEEFIKRRFLKWDGNSKHPKYYILNPVYLEGNAGVVLHK